MSNQDQSLLAGAQVEDRYEVLTKLGEGGFGAVYKARQRTTGQTVALKVMRLPETGGSEQAERRAARFLREARLSADLHHPNIVQLVDTGRGQGGGLYSVFAFAPGDDLAAVIAREGALAPREAQHLMLEVLDALACAHAAGVIHRDLKPSNIMVVPSGARRNALVLDFGIGAVIGPPAGESGSRLTGSGDAVGTPGYGAPEQWRGVEPSARADLFSWGLVFLECLLGEPVYRGTAAEIFYQLLGPDPVPIPPALDGHPLGDVLRSALRKDVDARDVTARSLFAALDACDLRDLSREALRAPDSAAPAAAPSTLSLSDTGPRAAAERRQVTALSCHVRLHDRAAGEDADDTLRTALTSAAAIARRHRGRVVSGLGDHLLVYFGYPRAEEGDALRAGRAALAIAETVPASVGLHTGIILAGDAGGLDVALGETPRLAARLAVSAAPGSVAVTAAAHSLLRAAFDLDGDPGADTFLLRRERSTETPGATREGPLVGRAQELSLLLDRWRRTPGGAGSAGLITGEPGIGKSRLVQELRRAVSEPHLFLEGRCSPDTQNNALFPVIDLLSRAVGLDQEADSPDARTKRLEAEIARLGLSLPETMPVLLPLFSLPIAAPYAPLDVSPQRLKTLTLNAAVSLLSSMAERRPLLLLVEDLHWADPTTNELLAQLVREAPSSPMCLLLTARPEYAPSFPTMGMLQLPLGRLGRRDVEALVTDLVGKKAVPGEVVDQVASRTEGVPLFVEELIRMMADSGVLVERGDRYELAGSLADLEMPGTLRALLTARLDRMGRAKETAQVAAALGREFSVEVLSLVSPLGAAAVEDDLDRLMTAGLVLRKRRQRDPVGMFKHALVQDAAYESLSNEGRREVHGRIAGVLEDRFPDLVRGRPDLLAHHHTEAGTIDRAIPLWVQAGQLSLGQSANPEAAQHFQHGLDLLLTTPETPMRAGQELGIRLPLSAALSATQGYGAPAVGVEFQRAREICDLLGDSKQLFPVLWGLGAFHAVRADLATSLDLSHRALTVAEREADSALLVPAYLMHGGNHFWRSDLRPARELFERGLQHYRPEEHAPLAAIYSYDPGTAMMAYLSLALWFLGYPDEALEKSRAAVEQTKAMGHTHSYVHALVREAEVHLLRRDGQAALEDLAIVTKLSEEKGFPMWLAAGQFFRGHALRLTGQVEKGIEEMREGMRRTLETGAQVMYPEYVAWLAEALGEAGHVEEALALVDDGLKMAERTTAGLFEPELYRLTAELTMRSGGPGADPARQALDLARRRGAGAWERRARETLERI